MALEDILGVISRAWRRVYPTSEVVNAEKV
jgi:hypothetical protein